MTGPPLDASATRARYKVQRRLARGGMGDIWLADDATEGRPVVLKTMRKVQEGADGAWTRFLREIQVLREVRHPGLVRLLDVVDQAGQLILVLEYVEGTDLASFARATPLGPEEVLEVGVTVGAALGALHARGISHRDLTPHNVVRRDGGGYVLLDLGLAHLPGVESVTGTEFLVGKPAYIAPDALTQPQRSPRQDVWQLGATLFEALTGRRRVPGNSLQECMTNIHQGRYQPFPGDPEACPSALRVALETLMAQDPARRPADGAAAAALLAAVDLGARPAAPPAAAVATEPRPGTRGDGAPRFAGFTLMAAVVVLAGLGLGWSGLVGREAGPAAVPRTAWEGLAEAGEVQVRAVARAPRPPRAPPAEPAAVGVRAVHPEALTAQHEVRLQADAAAVLTWRGAPLVFASLAPGVARLPAAASWQARPVARVGQGATRASLDLDLRPSLQQFATTVWSLGEDTFRAELPAPFLVARPPSAALLEAAGVWLPEVLAERSLQSRGRRLVSLFSREWSRFVAAGARLPPWVQALPPERLGAVGLASDWPAADPLRELARRDRVPRSTEIFSDISVDPRIEDPRPLRRRAWFGIAVEAADIATPLTFAVRVGDLPEGAWVRVWTLGTVSTTMVLEFPPATRRRARLHWATLSPAVLAAHGEYLVVDVIGGEGSASPAPEDMGIRIYPPAALARPRPVP